MTEALPPTQLQKSPKRALLVIVAGLASTAIALFVVYLLDAHADTNPMGWYADYVIPVGALVVGLVASSGYALAARLTGLKIRRALLALIVVLQIGGYFSAKYIEFAAQGPLVHQDNGQPVGFFEYFHVTTINMAWKSDHDLNNARTPLGNLGYAVRFGELVGFVLGTLVSPFLLSKTPYCDACEQYMKTASLASLPASNTRAGHLFGKKASPLTAQEIMESGMTDVVELVSLATAADAPAFSAKLNALAPQRAQAKKLSRRIDVRLISCARCHAGKLDVQLVETQGRQASSRSLGQTELTPQFIRDCRAQSSA